MIDQMTELYGVMCLLAYFEPSRTVISDFRPAEFLYQKSSSFLVQSFWLSGLA
jgi:hypothetical protein